MVYKTNPAQSQDMVAHAVQRWLDTGEALPPKQRQIYHAIACRTGRKSIIEAGCGSGIGTMILRGIPFIHRGEEAVHRIAIGTDVSEHHISYCQEFHPWGHWDLWDIEAGPYKAKIYDVVVAVEVLEHVTDYIGALEHLAWTCREEVWISTPNRLAEGLTPMGPPSNPHHVREFAPFELLELGRQFFSSVECFSVNVAGGLVAVVGEHNIAHHASTPMVYRMIL